MPKLIENGKVKIPSGKNGLPDIDIYYETYSSSTNKNVPSEVNKPTFLFLHGGPGILCHKMYVPFWSQIADVANVKVEFIDLRGHGESGGHKEIYQETWSLAQWADDVVEYCKVRNIEKPIVGCFSLGTWIGYPYLIRHPQHASKVLFVNGEPWVNVALRAEKYNKRAIQKALKDGQSTYNAKCYGEKVKQIVLDLELIAIGKKKADPSTDTAKMYIQHCMPLFSNNPYQSKELSSCTKPNIALWQYFDVNEYYSFDFRNGLTRLKDTYDFFVQSGQHIPKILMIAGEYDPEHPKEGALEAKELLGEHATCIVIKNTGDPVYRDQPKTSLEVLKTCILQQPFAPTESAQHAMADDVGTLMDIYSSRKSEGMLKFIWGRYANYHL